MQVCTVAELDTDFAVWVGRRSESNLLGTTRWGEGGGGGGAMFPAGFAFSPESDATKSGVICKSSHH